MARTVLLADDSVTAQNMGRRILTDAGYEVITVNNGSAALKKIHEARPDLIVLDVYMPGYGGLEVCQRLKESGDTMRIPVLLTVGKMEPFKVDEAKRVRADGHIVKPFEASELLAALTRLEDRIVPQDSGKGRKKPSFWHGGRDETREWTDNVAYLAEAKTRKHDEDPADDPEVVVEVVKTNRHGDTVVPEPTGELPVIADSQSESAIEQAPSTAAVVEMGEDTPETPVAEMRNPEDQSIQHTASPLRAEPEQVSAMPAGRRWIAEDVALTPEEAALELEQEMRAAEAEAEAAEARTEMRGEGSSGATFAAAAGASTLSSSAAVRASAPVETEVSQGHETAAAWQNWQQIRDAVMSTHAPEAIAEKAAQVAATERTSAGPEPQEPSGISAAEEGSAQEDSGEEAALANIVDTVLAELKPKLMKEIAKKLKK